MGKILGIDLGTNSIGLTLREDDIFSWYGVYTFKKGVGQRKSREFSYAAERRKHRSSRRLYNARRYRKWETLKTLIEFEFCPLKKEYLERWVHFETTKDEYDKSIGRIFPIYDNSFNNWIKLDFNGDGIPEFTSPYQLRKFLISEKLDLSILENRHKVGRALYHIAQRRGFRSSRKSGANEKTAVYKGGKKTKTIGRDEYKNLITEHKTLGAAFSYLEDKGLRVRNRYTLRSDYQTELKQIIAFQEIDNIDFTTKIEKAIFYQRPLRSNKGLVGKCTLEPNKSRCPISHPKFEEYRAWSFINNIKFRSEETSEFESLPLELKKQLYQEKFFLKNKREFSFLEIRKFIQQNLGSNLVLNYSLRMDDISIPSCYVSARLKAVFGEDWQHFEKKIEQKNKNGENKVITYTIEDIWHILFSFEHEDNFREFLDDKLCLSENQIKEMIKLFNDFPIGYANLSLKAINNILPFLREGFIYTEAVILSKIPQILGSNYYDNEEVLKQYLTEEISKNRYEKIIVAITNNLISKYFMLDFADRYGWRDSTYILDANDIKDIDISIKEYFGKNTWEAKPLEEKNKILYDVKSLYQTFFSDFKMEYKTQPKLLEQIKKYLKDNYNVSLRDLEKLYHPSQIDIYPSKENQMLLGSPKTTAFKNPMVYKTLYKLRDIINYLIETNRIDNETRIVVEVARDLNDANRRWAIETYQRRREAENLEFATAIRELINDNDFSGFADPNSDKDIDKFRLWVEQIENYEKISKEVVAIDKDKSIPNKDIQKYRLWKEQNCTCMYTGKIINLANLFDENKVDFEHTIPRSRSFDNSLANLTVCYSDYNRNVKKNKLPVELPNYESEELSYSAIKPRLEAWEKKIDSLKDRIETKNKNSRLAIDKEKKDEAIRQRHLLQMEYDYWKNKLDRFTRTEVPQGFINSQLNDTQIITKYAFHYLKTVFNRVDVIKGSITAQFRKIYGIQTRFDKKDRTQHFHHAIDAAVLTLIPSAKNREEILKKAYEFEEKPENKNMQYREKPFPTFNNFIFEEIKKNILINNLTDKDQTLTPGKKIVRKRGKIVWIDKENRKPKISQGDSIRGELHKQTYYGKIKIAAKDEKGTLLRDENANIIYNQINGVDEVWMALRVLVTDSKFKADNIIDTTLRKYLQEQLKEKKVTELVDFKGNIIRHIRCRAKLGRGFMNPQNATVVKEQTYKSLKDYKNYIYADSGDNYIFGLYENIYGRRDVISVNKFEASKFISELNLSDKSDLFKMKEPVLIEKVEAELIHIFEIGQKVIFYKSSRDEIKDLYETDKIEISKRLYFIKRLYQVSVGRIQFQHHLEARTDEELLKAFTESVGRDGFSKYQEDFVAPRLLLSPKNFNFIIEGKDFEMKLDGTIEFKF